MKQTSTKQKLQLDMANEALVALAENITASDRKDAGRSEYTVIEYIKGRGKNLDTAIELLAFFRKRIETRNKAIDHKATAA